MTILLVWQECSSNLLWIVFSCTSLPRPLVRASPNDSPTVEFGVRGGALPLALSPFLVVVRWDGDEAALGCLTAIPLHCVILQGWKFFFLSLSARSYSCGPINIASTIAEGTMLLKLERFTHHSRIRRESSCDHTCTSAKVRWQAWKLKITFKYSFFNMIHSYPDLSNIQKLNYLHLTLSGRAESPIESFTISKDNYTTTRVQLFDADNKRAIVLRHATLLIDMLEMIDDSSASIHDFVNHMQAPILSPRALWWIGVIRNNLLFSCDYLFMDTKMPQLNEVFNYLRSASRRYKHHFDSTAVNRLTDLQSRVFTYQVCKYETGICL